MFPGQQRETAREKTSQATGRIAAPRAIVVFRALQLGDLLCTVPALRALRKKYPQAHITLVSLPWAASFVERFSTYLDAFIAFPGWPGLPEQEIQHEKVPAFLAEVQARRFDLALQMQGSGNITNPLVALFGAKQAAGYFQPGQYCPNPDTFFAYPNGEHEIRVFVRLMEQLGIPAQGLALEFPLSQAERDQFRQFRQAHQLTPGSYICLHPGARFIGRRWATEKFAALGDQLSERGYQMVLTGSAAERPLTEEVAAKMRHPAFNLAGETDLATVALLIEHARLLISNDTGVSHIAAALQTPSVILFSASDPNRWRPLNEALHPIILRADQAEPAQVLAVADQVLTKEREYDARPPA